MGKSAQNKELLKTLSTAFNIKKKHINIQQNEDGSYQLKIKKISAETIGNIIQNNHLALSSVDLKTPPISSVKTIDPMSDADINALPTIDNESITLPKSFNEIPLPCDCLNCQLNTAYELYIQGQNNLQDFLKIHKLPPQRKIRSSSTLKQAYGDLLSQKKRLSRVLTAHKRNILDLIVKANTNIAEPNKSRLDKFSIDPSNKVLTYNAIRNQVAYFSIPSTCLNQAGSFVLNKPSPRVDDSADSTKGRSSAINSNTLDGQNCDCITCELNFKYNQLKRLQSDFKKTFNIQHHANSPRLKKNVTRSMRNKRRAERKLLAKQIDILGKEIAIQIPKLGVIVALPNPKCPSLQPTDKHNTVRYSSITNKRIEFVIPSKCLNSINHQDLDCLTTSQDSAVDLAQPENISIDDEIDDQAIIQSVSTDLEEKPTDLEENLGEYFSGDPLLSEVECNQTDMLDHHTSLDLHDGLFKTDISKAESQQTQQATFECQCVYCVINPFYSKLKKQTHLFLSLNAKIKSLTPSNSKSRKSTAKNLQQTIADLQKQKKTASYQIKMVNQSIVDKMNLFSNLIQPHPTKSSIAVLKQANTISYSSIDGIRIRLTLIKDCKN